MFSTGYQRSEFLRIYFDSTVCAKGRTDFERANKFNQIEFEGSSCFTSLVGTNKLLSSQVSDTDRCRGAHQTTSMNKRCTQEIPHFGDLVVSSYK